VIAVLILIAGALAGLETSAVEAGQEPVISGYGRTIQFSGLEWRAKTSNMLVGPGPNYFSDSDRNVWTDDDGHLHLRLTRDAAGRWQAAEVVLQPSLGYGTYRFRVDGPARELDPNVVFGMFTWHDDPTDNHRELDVEIARWGNPSAPNGRYTVQPFETPGRMFDFEQPPVAVRSTHRIDWQPGRVRFQSWRGWEPEPTSLDAIIAEHVFDEGIPRAGGEQARINLWLDDGAAPREDAGVEVVVSSFDFIPTDPAMQ
jgi:hypothetical protein